MPQLQDLYPNSDITVGTFTPTPLWQNTDSISDAEYIQSGLLIAPSTCEVKMTQGEGPDNGDPGNDFGPMTVQVRACQDLAPGQQITMDFYLYEGTTLIASSTGHGMSTVFLTKTLTLTGAQIASITSWNDLRVRITGSGDFALPRRRLRVSFARLIIPMYQGQTRIRGSVSASSTIYDATLE